jgi:hypothetical protein
MLKSDDLAKSRHTGENRCPVFQLLSEKHWIPAFAGMTRWCDFPLRRDPLLHHYFFSGVVIGISTVKSAPFPTSLFRLILPPSFSIML